MVFMNKETNDAYVDCYCGCDTGFRIRIDKDDSDGLYCVISYTSGSFYSQQSSWLDRLLLKINKIWAIIRNKDFYYSEVTMTQDDFHKFKEYIDSID